MPPNGDDSNGTSSRSRRIVVGLLVVLTSISVVIGSIGFWVHNVLLDTDKFMATVGPALDDPDFYTALGGYVSDQTLEALDLETRISTALSQLDDFLFNAVIDALGIEERGQALLNSFDRPTLESLAPTITSGLEERITNRINNFVTSPEFQARLPELVRAAHEGTIALLRGNFAEIPNVSVVDGQVQLNMIPIIGEAIRRVLPELNGLGGEITLPDSLSDKAAEARQQLEDAIGAKVPEDFGQLTVMSEAQLTQLQDGVVTVDRIAWAMVIFSLILIAVTLWISRTRRRTAIQLAVGILIGVPVTEALLRWLETQIVDAVTNPSGEIAALGIFHQMAAGLRQVEYWIAFGALLLGFIAYLSGRPAWAMRLKAWWEQLLEPGEGGENRTGRWISEHYDLVRVIGVVVAIVALYIPELSLLWMVIVGALLALYLWVASQIKNNAVAAAPAEDTVSV